MGSAGSGHSSCDCTSSSLDQILADVNNDTEQTLRLNREEVSVRAPTVTALALEGKMQVQVEKAGMTSVPFDVPLAVKAALLEHQTSSCDLNNCKQEQRQHSPLQQSISMTAATGEFLIKINNVTIDYITIIFYIFGSVTAF